MNGKLFFQNRSSPKSIESFSLEAGTFLLGRSVECDFVVFDATVSRRHAEITVADGGVFMRDLGSRNGTYLDGKRVGECSINAGNRVRFGDVIFELVMPGAQGKNPNLEEETSSCDNSQEQLSFDQSKFSVAQCRVFNLLLNGLAEKEMASQLHLSLHTVHNHVRAIYRILHVHSRAELLVRFIQKNGD